MTQSLKLNESLKVMKTILTGDIKATLTVQVHGICFNLDIVSQRVRVMKKTMMNGQTTSATLWRASCLTNIFVIRWSEETACACYYTVTQYPSLI